MKTQKILACFLLAAPAWTVHAYPGVLRDVENFSRAHAATCPRNVTPQTMADCTQKSNARGQALDRYLHDRNSATEPRFEIHPAAPAKPSGLCFTRKATGEVVCPNQ